ncbi:MULTISPECIES: TonB-dependent receptor domain-containing protein [unclassified Caulobacter]|uniref:TonB-dependent receptor domain-containing protein n=1 Tax=unclassified Caulobacter TaxID=2648921 RepID=UPI0009E8D38E|nr:MULTISPECIES: TonB-dependent receptor [unclassified Caulobacter]
MALKTKVLLATTMLGSLAAFAPTITLAQTAPTTGSEATSVEEVVVTGSRIRRDPTNSPTPLIQVSRDDVVATGQASVIDVLADIPALSGSQVPEDTTGAGLNDGGLSVLNLRDLGASRTLTLVDGRRHVGSNGAGLQVDIDTIPRLLIQNVEVITGSNSALYGADAVSGVVNFVLRKDFDGLEIDGTAAQINQDGQLNKRISALAGKNFFDGRLNVYGSAEYEKSDEVRDSQVDWRKKAWVLLNNDTDVANNQPDGQFDNILIHDARSLSLGAAGGITVLASSTRPSANPNDPDIPFQQCTTSIAPMSANCFSQEPFNSFIYDNAGAGRAPSFGTFRDENGFTRLTNVGGDGLNPNTEFSQGSRLPRSKAYRFQGGANFNITEDIQLFSEAKYVKESTFDEGQQTFFDIGILPLAAGTVGGLFSTSAFNIGLDNAYLPSNVRSAILANSRTPITAYNATTGAITTTAPINDVRARHSLFGPLRSQLNKKELQRYVVGLRGSKDDLGFVHNLAYELGYTYGKLENKNYERGVDVVRFKNSVDAVVDTAGVVAGKPGDVVCRVKLLEAQGVAIPDQNRGGNYAKGTKAYEEVSNCVASRVFGPGGASAAAQKYYTAEINVQEQNKQQDALAYVSGELWDFWGAGRIGLALGAEWRREETQAIGRSSSAGDRLLFLNTGPDFAPASYETKEYFGEFRLPLLHDVPLAKNLEIGAAYRHSDYTTIGVTETYNFNAIWRPIQDIMFRATSGKSVRAPTLGETYRPATQTFANNFTDPCDARVITNLTDAKIKANREKNCVALGIPSGTNIIYTSGIQGKNAGNPFLKPEKSFSVTASMIITPRFWPNATFVVDYYDIDIKDVIASVTAQVAANQCVSGDVLNAGICSTVSRIGATPSGITPAYGINDFIQGSVNYARTMNRGIDYQFLYHTDIENIIGKDWGRISYKLSGNYLFEQHDFTNISNPDEHTDFETGLGLPRVRFASKLTWEVNDKLSLAWNADWQSSQWLTLLGGTRPYDVDDAKVDPDNRDPRYYKTTPFVQHDFTVMYAPREHLIMRAGVVNAFDEEPNRWLGNTTQDNFDLFGRRFFVGFNYKM